MIDTWERAHAVEDGKGSLISYLSLSHGLKQTEREWQDETGKIKPSALDNRKPLERQIMRKHQMTTAIVV